MLTEYLFHQQRCNCIRPLILHSHCNGPTSIIISNNEDILVLLALAYIFSCCADEQKVEDNQNIDHASVRAHNDDIVSE